MFMTILSFCEMVDGDRKKQFVLHNSRETSLAG